MHPLAHAVYTVASGLTLNAAIASLLADHPALKSLLHEPIYGEPGGEPGLDRAAELLHSIGAPPDLYAGFLAHLAQDVWWEENVRKALLGLSLDERRSIETCWSIRHIKETEDRRRAAEIVLSISYARQAELEQLLYLLSKDRRSVAGYLDMCREHYERPYTGPEKRYCKVIEDRFSPRGIVAYAHVTLERLGVL